MRLIDADPVMVQIPYEECNARMVIASAPTVDAEPVKHGHWIGEKPKTKFFFSQRVFKCSVCGHYLDFDGVNAGRGSANFCPNCEAKMDEEVNENEAY